MFKYNHVSGLIKVHYKQMALKCVVFSVIRTRGNRLSLFQDKATDQKFQGTVKMGAVLTLMIRIND